MWKLQCYEIKLYKNEQLQAYYATPPDTTHNVLFGQDPFELHKNDTCFYAHHLQNVISYVLILGTAHLYTFNPKML